MNAQPATTPLTSDEIAQVGAELKRLVDMEVISYYLPTIPEGEQFIIGLKGQILKMTPDQIPCFLAGVTAVSEFAARRLGLQI